MKRNGKRTSHTSICVVNAFEINKDGFCISNWSIAFSFQLQKIGVDGKFCNEMNRDKTNWPICIRFESFVAEVICASLSWYWDSVTVINASSFRSLSSRFSRLGYVYDSIIVKYRSIHCSLVSASDIESSTIHLPQTGTCTAHTHTHTPGHTSSLIWDFYLAMII